MIATVKRFMARRLPVPMYLWLSSIWIVVSAYYAWHPIIGWVALALSFAITNALIRDTQPDPSKPVLIITTNRSKPPSCPLGAWHFGPCPPADKGVNK